MAEASGRLAARALQHIHHLSETIGPRPAGSPAERRALEYAEGLLAGWGYAVERQPVRFAPLPGFLPLQSLLGLALAAAGWLLPVYPVLALLLPALAAAAPQAWTWLLAQRLPTADSANVLALPPAQGEPAAPALILCAHVDSAPASPLRHPLLSRLQARTMDIVQRVAIGLALLGLLRLVGLPLPGWLAGLAAAAASAAGAWLIFTEQASQAAWRSPAAVYSPGANDNASGVGALLALAEHYRPDGSAPRLAFLFTAAEETGLHGARAAAGWIAARWPGSPLLCLDMVGSGSALRVVTRQGVFWPQRADEALLRRIQQAAPHAAPLAHTLMSGDYAAFLAAGLPAGALQVTGGAQVELAYHSAGDRLEKIEPAALELALQAVVRLVEQPAAADLASL